jgi:hypothetical protein
MNSILLKYAFDPFKKIPACLSNPCSRFKKKIIITVMFLNKLYRMKQIALGIQKSMMNFFTTLAKRGSYNKFGPH